MKFYQAKKLTVAQQYFRLKASKISLGTGYVNRHGLEWNFDARPMPISRSYRITIRYSQNGSPEVYVIQPDLSILAEGKELPHVYSQSHPVQLCLHYPKNCEWSGSKSIADTIVPWTYLWLAYFEDWLVSGEWNGGGIHPGESANES